MIKQKQAKISLLSHGFITEIDLRFGWEKTHHNNLEERKLIKNINIILDKETEIKLLDIHIHTHTNAKESM